ncbi:MAG: copper chaperone PCu(A)C [Sphingomonadales bacterium]|nr:copper chaperone PCu(A)C [Sphingomonadales bacterium]MBD3773214.1 copper chaperone PCu(A)C [Paracoccaceae bacterium]
MNKTFLAGIALGLSALTLVACNEKASEPVAEAPEGIPGLVVSNARLILPPVAGNPAAVYFDLKNGGKDAVSLAAADVADAKSAMLHETTETDGKMTMGHMASLDIKPGETVAFAPGGKHVMAMDVSPELQPGAKTEVTLTFSSGDKISFPADVVAAGADR